MIKRIKLVNFRSHKNTELFFGPITSLIGTSNAGKTHVWRALKIILYNETFSEKSIRWGSEKAEIEVEFDNGLTIYRWKTKSAQGAEIRHPDGRTEVFTGQRDYTDLIKGLTGFRKVDLEGTGTLEELNFMGVHDQPFLLGSRPENTQRKVSKLLGTEKLDGALLRLSKKEKEISKEISALTGRRTLLKPAIESLQESLSECEASFEEIKKTQEKVDALRNQLKKLKDLSQRHTDIVHQVLEIDQRLLDSTKLEGLKVKSSILRYLKKKFSFLAEAGLEEDFDSLKTKDLLWRVLRLRRGLRLVDARVSELEAGLERISGLKARIADRQKVLEALESHRRKKSEVNIINDKLASLESKATEVRRELTKLGRCPVCGSKLHLHHGSSHLRGQEGS